MEDPHRAQEARVRKEKEAIRRLSARGIEDPRLPVGRCKNFDVWREYDRQLAEEMELLSML